MARVKSYDRPERKPKITGTRAILTEAEARYVRKASQLRARISRKSLARKYGVALSTISNYATNDVKRYRADP